MPADIDYEKSVEYTDFETIYTECSGPGGLKLAEFIASKLALKPQDRLLDIGLHGGYQTCFLAKEYGVFAVGIDPGDDHGKPGTSSVDRLMRNAQSWGVQDRILGIKVGVPDTKFAENSFDAAYSTTTLEMIRGWASEEEYRECLSEVLHIGWIFLSHLGRRSRHSGLWASRSSRRTMLQTHDSGGRNIASMIRTVALMLSM